MANFRSVLLKIDSELHGEDLESLKFLCSPNLTQRSAMDINSGHELFEILESKGLISEKDCSYLFKKLSTIGRMDLCASLMEENIGVDDSSSLNHQTHINTSCDSFYDTLFQISEEMSSEEVCHLRYLFNCVPKTKKTNTGIQLFKILLEREKISQSNLDSLIGNLDKDLGRADLARQLKEYMDKVRGQQALSTGELSSKTSEMNTEMSQTGMKTTYYSDDLMNRMKNMDLSSGAGDTPGTDASPFPKKEGNNSENLTVHLRPFESQDDLKPAGVSCSSHSETQDDSRPTSGEALPRYNMTSNPRGICLIIDNERFNYDEDDDEAKELRDRRGSHKDTENIKKCFSILQFDVRIKVNLTHTQLLSAFQDAAKDPANRSHNCFVGFVLSHGNTEHGTPFVYGNNGRKVYVDQITRLFRPDACPAMTGKPKLFFLACCLGGSYSRAVSRPLHLSETDSGIQTDSATDSASIPEEDGEQESLQSFVCNDQDFLIGYSTVKGNVSFRDTANGTWYITQLTQVLSEYYKRESLQHMLVVVNQRVAQNKHLCQNDRGVKGHYAQVPSPQHTLTKQLWF